MKILILGKGGREHALGWKLSKSPVRPSIYFMPGNAGTIQIGKNVEGDYNRFEDVLRAVRNYDIDLVVVGPEDPIARGIANFLEDNNIQVIAPRKEVAFLESSKIEAKRFMERHGIPTADFRVFYSYKDAEEYVKKAENFPLVIKADGLCAGKGVVIADEREVALLTLKDFMERGRFGESSKKVVIEEFLNGYEFSVFVYLDGERYTVLGDAIDYKRAYDNDKGPNTGGMGSIAPAIFLKQDMRERVRKDIIDKTVRGLIDEGLYYRGFLYFGLIWTHNGPYVLEYNVRMGDPETQVVTLLDTRDWLGLFGGRGLDGKWPVAKNICLEVVLVSGGYPINYKKGFVIEGLDEVKDVKVFHAGTAIKDGKVVTAGGRVLNVVGCGNTLEEVRGKVYEEVEKIRFENVFYRKDIGDVKRWKGIL